MAITNNGVTDMERDKFVEATDVAGAPAVRVANPDGTAIGSGQAIVDDAAFTPGTDEVVPNGYIVDDTATDSVDEGDAGAARMTADRMQIQTLGTKIAGEDQPGDVMKTVNQFFGDNSYTLSHDDSSALEASSVTKASSGVMVSAYGRIDSTASSDDYYVQFYDSATVPGNGAVTFIAGVLPLKIVHTSGTDSYFTISFPEENGRYAANGISWAISTTEFTKTVAAGSLAAVSVSYV